MNRRTNPQILKEFLEAWPSQRISMAKLQIELEALRGWPGDKVVRVVEIASRDPRNCISRGKGGTIEFTGSERSSEPLLYRHVARVLSTSWATEIRLKDPTPHFTAHGGHRGAMDWLHPDIVVTGRGRRGSGSDNGTRWHSFEVERPGGFHLNSIFQAFVQGRGSDFSWVVLSDEDVEREDYQERVLWSARQVGVGLITYGRPRAYSTWWHMLKAKPRAYTEVERENFKNYAIGELDLL